MLVACGDRRAVRVEREAPTLIDVSASGSPLLELDRSTLTPARRGVLLYTLELDWHFTEGEQSWMEIFHRVDGETVGFASEAPLTMGYTAQLKWGLLHEYELRSGPDGFPTEFSIAGYDRARAATRLWKTVRVDLRERP